MVLSKKINLSLLVLTFTLFIFYSSIKLVNIIFHDFILGTIFSTSIIIIWLSFSYLFYSLNLVYYKYEDYLHPAFIALIGSIISSISIGFIIMLYYEDYQYGFLLVSSIIIFGLSVLFTFFTSAILGKVSIDNFLKHKYLY